MVRVDATTFASPEHMFDRLGAVRDLEQDTAHVDRAVHERLEGNPHLRMPRVSTGPLPMAEFVDGDLVPDPLGNT